MINPIGNSHVMQSINMAKNNNKVHSKAAIEGTKAEESTESPSEKAREMRNQSSTATSKQKIDVYA